MEKKISRKQFDDIVEKYKNDKILFKELKRDEKRVEKDIYDACKFDLVEFGKTFPSGAYYYMYSLS